jgi:hypothetical protein
LDNHQPPIDHHLAKVLITELLWGKGVLKPDNARPIKLVLNSSTVLKHYLQEKDAISDNKLTAVKGRLCNLLFFLYLQPFNHGYRREAKQGILSDGISQS